MAALGLHNPARHEARIARSKPKQYPNVSLRRCICGHIQIAFGTVQSYLGAVVLSCRCLVTKVPLVLKVDYSEKSAQPA